MQKTAASIKHERLKAMPLRPVSGFRLPNGPITDRCLLITDYFKFSRHGLRA